MNRLLLAALPLLFCLPVAAQPDPNAVGMGKNLNPPATPPVPRIPQDTPANAVRYFISTLNSPFEPDFETAVSGARIGYYGDSDWEKARFEVFPFIKGVNLKVDDITVDSQTATDANVTVIAHNEMRDGQNRELRRGDTLKYALQLHREILPQPGNGAGNELWRVVPLPTETILNGSLFQLPLLPLIANLALRDSRVLPLVRQQAAISQLKQLGLGALQFTQDYDEVYAFDDAAHERALLPYVKNAQLFTIPGTKDEKWRFNDLLANKELASLPEPARTVLFYDGDATSTDSLHFRFADKTLICFADGHVKSFAKDELKDLIWAP